MTTAFVVRHRKFMSVLSVLCFLSSCSLYSFQAMTVRDALMNNQIDLAYSLVDDQFRYSDTVLKSMNKGMLLRMKNNFVSSNESLEQAKKRINKLYGISVTEQFGSVVINDSVMAYKGSRIEQLLLHAYMAMNYIETANLDAARVEMLQAEVKMREWGDQPDDDPFIKYLSGMIYEALDENDQAIIAYRHAIDAYKANKDKQHLDVPMLLVTDLMRLLKVERLNDDLRVLQDAYPQAGLIKADEVSGKGKLIIILSNGLSPIKSENSITTFSDEIEKTVRIALPVYAIEPARLKTARIVIGEYSDMLETVENIDGLARSVLDEEMPLILTRAIARAVVKHKSQHQASGGQSMGSVLITMANLVTERADTRSWSTLPQAIQMTSHFLPAGKHQLAIELLNDADFVVDRIKEEVEIKPGKVTFVFKHWISPRVREEQIKPEATTNKVSRAIQSERVALHV